MTPARGGQARRRARPRARHPLCHKLRGDDRLCYLGQSLGAAIFGAIFNAALTGKLHGAPALLRHRLPDQVSGVATALARLEAQGQLAPGQQAPGQLAPGQLAPGQAAEDYLRAALATAAGHV
jgi:hypothetical protein